MLSGMFVLVYISGKLDFFTSYFKTSSGIYLREHSIYWAAMAALAMVVWLLERRNEDSGR
jgi:hypothetical protein